MWWVRTLPPQIPIPLSEPKVGLSNIHLGGCTLEKNIVLDPGDVEREPSEPHRKCGMSMLSILVPNVSCLGEFSAPPTTRPKILVLPWTWIKLKPRFRFE